MKLYLHKTSAGQTLIETLAGLFILVMGVSASVSLAVYAFASSTNITKQIIAVGLAREGEEAVRNMRDTNWLNDTLVANGCYSYSSSSPDSASCYENWLGKSGGHNLFCLAPSNGGSCNGKLASNTYTLDIGASSGNVGALWNLQPSTHYGMVLDQGNSLGEGFYEQDGNTDCGKGSNPSDYCRKIIITNDTTDSPYNTDPNLSMLKVQSEVWWIDKKCPRAVDFSSASVTCRLELDSYLTNWKNY